MTPFRYQYMVIKKSMNLQIFIDVCKPLLGYSRIHARIRQRRVLPGRALTPPTFSLLCLIYHLSFLTTLHSCYFKFRFTTQLCVQQLLLVCWGHFLWITSPHPFSFSLLSWSHHLFTTATVLLLLRQRGALLHDSARSCHRWFKRRPFLIYLWLWGSVLQNGRLRS